MRLGILTLILLAGIGNPTETNTRRPDVNRSIASICRAEKRRKGKERKGKEREENVDMDVEGSRFSS